MFRLLNKRKGQNTAEYAILIGVIVAAAIAMQIYVRRGMQARVRDAVDFTQTADDNSGQTIFNGTQQYEPYYIDSSMQTTSGSQSSEAMTMGGGVRRDVTNEYTQRTGEIVYQNGTW
jgi:gas vesicle protein